MRKNEKAGKVLFLDKTHPVLKDNLKNIGFDCDERFNINYDELLRIAENYIGVVVRSSISLKKNFFDKAKNLCFVGRVGSGLENIDYIYAESLGVKCVNSPEGNRDAVGEHTLGLLLALKHNICKANTEISHGKWLREGNRGFEINNRTVGIIGYGNTGSAFAKRLAGFDANVIAYDKYKKGFSDSYVKEVSLDDIFNESNIVSLHVPLTKETYYMANNSFFEKFRKPIIIINTSRGHVLHTESLVKAIKNNKVIGAALDVLEYEGVSFENINAGDNEEILNYLIENDKVVITPHIAGVTHESNYKLSNVLFEKIKDICERT